MDLSHYQVEEILKDGSQVIIRALRESDKEAIREGFRRLSNESVQARFFRTKSRLSDKEVDYLTELDFNHHVGLGVALVENGQYLPIAVGRFIQSNDEAHVAELALAVADDYQGLGVGKLLVEHLSKIAVVLNIDTLECTILRSNIGMLRLLDSITQSVQREIESGLITARISTHST